MELQKIVVSVDGIGELHIIEPTYEQVEPLMSSESFGMELLKVCLHYPSGEKVFSQPVGISKVRSLMPLMQKCIEVCGFNDTGKD